MSYNLWNPQGEGAAAVTSAFRFSAPQVSADYDDDEDNFLETGALAPLIAWEEGQSNYT